MPPDDPTGGLSRFSAITELGANRGERAAVAPTGSFSRWPARLPEDGATDNGLGTRGGGE